MSAASIGSGDTGSGDTGSHDTGISNVGISNVGIGDTGIGDAGIGDAGMRGADGQDTGAATGHAPGQRLWIEGVALWAPSAEQPRAQPPLLAANERRRAPDAVLAALQVAHQAVQQSGRDARTLASLFCSAEGDLAIVDTVCATLADDPLRLSPTRFHHSVHNACAGYWAMAAHSHAPCSAVAGGAHSLALGWLEAATQVAVDQQPVLLVGVATAATGLLRQIHPQRSALALALLLAPAPSAAARAQVGWRWQPTPLDAPTIEPAPVLDPATQPAAGFAALPAAHPLQPAPLLLRALQAGLPCTQHWPCGPTGRLTLQITPLPPSAPPHLA